MSDDRLALEYQVGDWLRLRQLKLVTAESCTGGLVGHRITNVAGSSDYYLGGVISYANQAKQGLLGVRPVTLERYGAVSSETAVEMARGVCQAFNQAAAWEALVGISVTGIAGPGGGTADKPVGLVWIGLCGPAPTWAVNGQASPAARYEPSWRYVWHSDREENKALSAQQTLQLLLDYLRGKVTE